MCSDKYTRAKLSRDKVAVQGAINTSWTLHKAELLELKAEEMKHRAFDLILTRLNVKCLALIKNVTRMRASATALNALYAEAEACLQHPSIQEVEEATTKELTELRKSQEALMKALKRKEGDLLAVRNKEVVVQPPAECIVQELQLEEKPPNFHNIEDASAVAVCSPD